MKRRTFLELIAHLGVACAAPALSSRTARAASAERSVPASVWLEPDGTPVFRPVRLPVPVPWERGAGDGEGDGVAAAERFEVRDVLELPDGFVAQVVAAWGDRFGPPDDPSRQVRFGTNCDHTALVPIPGHDGEFHLVVNHEAISPRPWLEAYPSVLGRELPDLRLVPDPEDPDGEGRLRVGGLLLAGARVDLWEPERVGAELGIEPGELAQLGRDVRALAWSALEDLGVSVLRVRRRADGGLEVLTQAADHRRITGLESVNVAPREGWDRFVGGATALVQGSVTTFANCSGAVTPWGTVLSCEENFSDQVPEEIDASGAPLLTAGLPFAAGDADPLLHRPLEIGGLGIDRSGRPLDGRHFGWVVEIDPATGAARKHTSLGRFRHENVGLRCVPGSPLVAYLGDDRRGGHLWKFVSDGAVADPSDPATGELLTRGTLHVAAVEADGSGRWIPLEPDTPLARPAPERTATGHLWLPDRGHVDHHVVAGADRPKRAGGYVAVTDGRYPGLAVKPDEWVGHLEKAAGKPFAELRLRDLVRVPTDLARSGSARVAFERAVLLVDAYAMANAVGGTPMPRPEDVEVHPRDGSVFLACTDATGKADGSAEASPDRTVFPEAARASSRRYGAVYRLVEDEGAPDARLFRLERYLSSGEVSEGGGGFANPDNLSFDPDGNLWMLTDIKPTALNVAVDRESEEESPGGSRFPGVFGSNALFLVPTSGPHAGRPFCFATAPAEAELTGLSFTPDGKTLIVSVQHPGEVNGTRGGNGRALSEIRRVRVAGRDGSIVLQKRTVPVGSNFPSTTPSTPPRPAVVCITRRAPETREADAGAVMGATRRLLPARPIG